MLPSGRIKAVEEILHRLGDRNIPMDLTVGDYMRGRRYIGAKDRAEIARRCYDLVRSHARIGWHLARANAADTPRNRIIAGMRLIDRVDGARVHHLFDGSQYGPAPLNADEEKLCDALDGATLDDHHAPDAVRAECPPAFEGDLRARFGDDFMKEMTAMLYEAPLTLRVNATKADRDAAIKSFAREGITVTPTTWSPLGLRLSEKIFLSKTKAFTGGLVEIQDEGSQLIAHLCAAAPGMQVLDYCAGAGGKTLALAATMGNKGRIVAMDTEENRLAKARPRFKRAGIADIIEIRPLSDEKNRKWLRRQKETFDVALADVPCSGSGTWRRNPDMRWKQYGPGMNELLPVQADILERVAKTVKVGGRLVYATCSILADENEGQIERFLARHPDFSVLALGDAWPDGTPVPCDGPFMRLTPAQHDTDGFFAAVLVRTDSAPA